jgi:hypothetical protein
MTGNVSLACRQSHVPRRTVYRWLEQNERFRAIYNEALEDGNDSLEEEAWRRGVDGVLKPVYYRGKKVGSIRNTDLHTRRQETEFLRAAGYTEEGARSHIERYNLDFAAYVRTFSGGVRHEMDVVEAIENGEGSEFQQLSPATGIPISVILATKFEPQLWANRPCEPRRCHDLRQAFRQEWVKPMVPDPRRGRVVLDPQSGHDVPNDNPSIIISELRRVLADAGGSR